MVFHGMDMRRPVDSGSYCRLPGRRQISMVLCGIENCSQRYNVSVINILLTYSKLCS